MSSKKNLFSGTSSTAINSHSDGAHRDYENTINELNTEKAKLNREIENLKKQLDGLQKEKDDADNSAKEASDKVSQLQEALDSKDDQMKRLETRLMNQSLVNNGAKPYADFLSDKINDKNIHKKHIAIAKKIFYSKYGDVVRTRSKQRFEKKTLKDEDGYYIFDDDGTNRTPLKDTSIEYTQLNVKIPTALLEEAKRFAKDNFQSSIGLYMIISLIRDMYTSPLYEEYRKNNPFYADMDEIIKKPFKFLGETYFN